MIGSFRNFAKTKFAGILVFIMIIPFVFWGMGGMFSSGNSNTIAKINKETISTQEFIDHLNSSGIPEKTIKDNLKNNIIEELLSSLVSTVLLELEIKDYNLVITENTLLEKIKNNKNFHDEKGKFQRIKYEKFLLENNQSAPAFELRLKGRELQKNLFNYIGAGSVSPKFLINKLYKEENKKLEVEFINLKNFYKQKKDISQSELKEFLNENYDQLKVEYLDFKYAIVNPKNLIGSDEFNQSFFDKIDEIEIDISNEIDFETIVSKHNISPKYIKDFKISPDKNKIEKKIFQLKNNEFDIFESDDNYVIFKIDKIDERKPDLSDSQTKKEITELVYQKNKFEYNSKLLNDIRKKKFDNSDFLKMGEKKIENLELNSVKDNKKFQIDAVKILYSLPLNSFTLVNDEKNDVFIAKVKKVTNKPINDKKYNEYINKQNSNMKNSMLKTYDLFLNEKYKVVLNQQTIERVKNFFQ